jgi:hypothetical protein
VGTKPFQMEKLVDRVTAQSRALVVRVARHFYYVFYTLQIRQALCAKKEYILKVCGCRKMVLP